MFVNILSLFILCTYYLHVILIFINRICISDYCRIFNCALDL